MHASLLGTIYNGSYAHICITLLIFAGSSLKFSLYSVSSSYFLAWPVVYKIFPTCSFLYRSVLSMVY